MRKLLLLVALFGVACCAPAKGISADTSARRIVHEHTASHIEVEFDPADDKAALEEFVAKTRSAGTRAELVTAWAAIPSLKAKGDVLVNAFKDAEEDGSWPAAVAEADYIGGVRDAIAEFLSGGG